MPDDPLERHRKHLETPPDDFVAEKLELLGLSRDAFEKAPPIVAPARRKQLRIGPKGFEPSDTGSIKAHVKRVKPTSLDHLKELAGVPNRAFTGGGAGPGARRRAARPHLLDVDEERLAALPKDAKFASLEPADKDLVWSAAQNLLYGPATEEILVKPGYELVADTMLGLAAKLAAFFAQDLVVEDHTSVSFTGFGTLYFNNVLVYGNGGIRLGDNAKLVAYSVKHL